MLTDIKQIPKNSRIYIYGTGSAGRSLYVWIIKCLENITLVGFIDSFKQGDMLGIPIIKFDDFREKVNPDSYDLVLIASGAYKIIIENLREKGISNVESVSVPSYIMSYVLPTKDKFLSLRLQIYYKKYKRNNIHLFFGEHGGKFIGNNKYFYLFLRNKIKAPVYWVTNNKVHYSELKQEGIDVLDFGSKDFNKYLFKASFFYFDNMTWQREYPWLQFFKAKKIHMSHGVGLKLTEKMMIPEDFMEALTKKEKKRLYRRIFKNDLLISTSKFYAENVSEPAYGTPLRDIVLTGYPKNDIFYTDIQGENIFSDRNILKKIDKFKEKEYKTIVYAPTFRDMDGGFKYSDIIDFILLNDFLIENKMIIVIKGHTNFNEANKDLSEQSNNILIYDNTKDGYPLLKRSDLLITDYSSIYMDYLHQKKPVIFFNYDYDEYSLLHRELQFDYFEMTPGPKVKDLSELKNWLLYFLIENKDGFKKNRESIFKLAFKYKDGLSSQRVYEEILNISYLC